MEQKITPKILSTTLTLGMKLAEFGQQPSDKEKSLALDILEENLSDETLTQLNNMAKELEEHHKIRVCELTLHKMKKELRT